MISFVKIPNLFTRKQVMLSLKIIQILEFVTLFIRNIVSKGPKYRRFKQM